MASAQQSGSDRCRQVASPSARSAAIAAAKRGWAVFPCRPGDKRPAVDRWEERACADPERVARYWPSDRHNVGVACGPAGLVVVDLDTATHGGELPPDWQGPGMVDGADVLAALAERTGKPWPVTYTVRTRSGGTHLYFRSAPDREIRNSAGKVGPMVDVRGAGGYVVGAGSVVGGQPYEVVLDQDPELLPGWLADLADPPVADRRTSPAPAPGEMYPRLRGLVETVLRSRAGNRNAPLFWAACRAGEMVAAGEIDRPTAERVLVQAAVEAGLRGGESEARRTVASGMRSVA